MSYQIEEIKGAFVVTELKPVTLGTFLDPGLAHLFVAALEQEFQPQSDPVDTTAGQGSQGGLDERMADPSRIPTSASNPSTPDPAPTSEGQKGYKRDGPREVRTDTDLEADFTEALGRIAAGERCGDVASDMNLPFGALRARRAAFVKAQKAELAETPDKVKRKATTPWTTDLDLEVMDARDDQAALERIAQETGRTVAQCKARVDMLLKQAQREMEG